MASVGSEALGRGTDRQFPDIILLSDPRPACGPQNGRRGCPGKGFVCSLHNTLRFLSLAPGGSWRITRFSDLPSEPAWLSRTGQRAPSWTPGTPEH